MIIRLAGSPIGRRLSGRPDRPPVEERGNDDEDDPPEPTWCADCDREILLEQPRCDSCGGEAITVWERARRRGELPVNNSATDVVLRADVRTVVMPGPTPGGAPQDTPQ